jgi:predicted alpha/beta superfamily hydrolase
MGRCNPARVLARSLLLATLALVGCGGGEGAHQDSFSIHSTNVGADYQVYVTLPRGYGDDEAARYDTIYLLDANWYNAWAPQLITQLIEQRQMEPVILVDLCAIEALQPGVDPDPWRERDLTPTVDPATPGSGHAASFALFLRNELIPYIDGRYRTNPTREGRGLTGQSLGGLFTWYAAFTMNDVFSKYVPASASIWYDDRVLYTFEADYAAGHSDLAAEIYSTVGTEEGGDMVVDRDGLVSRLSARGYPGLVLQTMTYSGLTHNETAYPSYRDGWAALY